MIRATVPALAGAPEDIRLQVAALPRTIAAHDGKMAELPFMNAIETGGNAASAGPLAFPFEVAAWNLERCLFPEATAGLLRQATSAPVVLVSEMDDGMARTGQRNTTADLAGLLGMAYAYGVEFLELGLGSATERAFCKDDFNLHGFHGNGLMAAVPLAQPFMLRLEGERLWFIDGGDQPRLGERMAIGAVIETDAGPIVIVSVHLESATTAAYRERQVASLIDALDEAFPGVPVLIGGDLNTGNHAGGDFEAEGLFRQAAARGFSRHGGPLDRMTTRPSLITRWPERAMKLDWFLARGLVVGETRIVPSLDETGRPLSDHDLIVCRIEGLE
ncbi:endonuclease/exonuclease/phosphatase family protein [Rhizobium sp. GN54]|uniref:endonuclease/exonuclease/phosphatase family protein n=1 Tax=Rhizobium sp. GN54 TaxID=2898150 RepID=UPI001E616F63|nr:endonuclease [Rhizobium sp. GN54]MCD2185179.1 endonuclease [Rhizobium sp. GN54]